MNPFVWLLFTVIEIYIWILIAGVVLSWLFAFNVINSQNDFVRQVAYVIERLTEPALAPIRRMLPNLGGIDLSPAVLILGLLFLRQFIDYYLVRGI
jgi:YggT family protein